MHKSAGGCYLGLSCQRFTLVVLDQRLREKSLKQGGPSSSAGLWKVAFMWLGCPRSAGATLLAVAT